MQTAPEEDSMVNLLDKDLKVTPSKKFKDQREDLEFKKIVIEHT